MPLGWTPPRTPTCLICSQDPETKQHLMYQEPERLTVWSWLEGTIVFDVRLLILSKRRLMIRGHIFGPVGNLPFSYSLSGCLSLNQLEGKEYLTHTMPRRSKESLWKVLRNLDPNSLFQHILNILNRCTTAFRKVPQAE
ncbi:hypothetical protein OUZ56_023858 [Daphnia magna]|uniref:Uncharacterized protein n=1 Tax=Daphnia magna TaxID=35525 RepID=A0ABR0AZN7_9CRUS|nr:hypothetical protein OUZ56_023858 [Daphnia magna]